MRFYEHRIRGEKGFTLIEICVSMAIAILLLSVAVMDIQGLRAEHDLQRLAASVESQIRQTYKQALISQQPQWIDLSSDALLMGTRFQDPIKLTIRRSNETQFRKPKKNEDWQFSEQGFCEPLSLHLRCPNGIIEMDFDPLTGCPRRKSIVVTSK